MNQNDSPENETAQTVCFRLPESIVRKLDELSVVEKRTRANMLNKIVTDYLEQVSA